MTFETSVLEENQTATDAAESDSDKPYDVQQAAWDLLRLLKELKIPMPVDATSAPVQTTPAMDDLQLDRQK